MIYDVKIHTDNRERSFIFVVNALDDEEAMQLSRESVKEIDPLLEIRHIEARISKFHP